MNRMLKTGLTWVSSISLFFFTLSLSVQAEPLQIWISSFQDKVYYESMVKLYREKVDSDFEAQIKAYGFREMPDKLTVAIKTGVNPPDIVQLDEVLFGTYLAGEVPFVELSDRIKKVNLDKDILPQRLKLFAYKGKTYGLPQSLSAIVLYYRTDLFEKFHLAPWQINTWASFVRKGRELAAEGQAMIALDPTYFGILLRQKGSDLFDESGKIFPNEKAAVETLKWLHELHRDQIGILPERASIFDPVFFNSTVAYGEILCVMGADWYGLDMLQQFTPDLKGKWGVMPLPAWVDENGNPGPRTSTFAGQGLLIYHKSKRVEDSWKFMEFVITDPDANAKRFLDGNSFPAYQPAWKDERLMKSFPFFNNQPLGKILAELAPQLPEVVMHPKRPEAVFLFQESFFSSLMYGQMTPREVISEMKKQLGRH